jgi:DMSO/TMAO reductase YedYZ molybdopterin-dependent catalytic subunit
VTLATANNDGEPFTGLITREREPINLEFPFAALDGLITPDNLFYVRNHFPVPRINVAEWRLTISGAVEQHVELSYDELRKLPPRTVMATLECAGNSRVYLVPKVRGTAWGQGAVSNAEWTGVPLSLLLENAGIKSSAVDVVLEGADRGEVKDDPISPGPIHFARSLPLAKAMQDEVLIAYKMNGNDLSPEHGYPVRAVVPGWYGMASVKWLTRIIVTDHEFQGYWQTLEYVSWRRENDLPVLEPLGEAQVKSQISRPTAYESVRAGTPHLVRGAAWSGESTVARVELSCDGGQSWHEVELTDDAIPFAWRRWEYLWSVPQTRGRLSLMVRATDEKGNVQPDHRDPDRRNYTINHVVPVEIDVV